MRRGGGLLAALILLAALPAAAWQLAEPWPTDAETAAIGGEPVTFPSSSPFTPRDAARAPPAMAIGTLYRPRGSLARGAPGVVLLHGAGGVLRAREHLYARQFAAMGAAALVVDVFAARGGRMMGFSERLLAITESMAIADAYAGLRFLARQPGVDRSRVALIGFSYGAMATKYALSSQVAALMAPSGERFAAHAAFYGPCIARFENPRTTGAPLLILYGTGDALIDPGRCAEFAADARRGGSAVEVVAYPGAPHQWDGGTPPRRIGRLLNGCRLGVGADGSVRDLRTGLPMDGPLLRRAILAFCVENEPYVIGGDEAVRLRSNRDLGRFLDRVFAR